MVGTPRSPFMCIEASGCNRRKSCLIDVEEVKFRYITYKCLIGSLTDSQNPSVTTMRIRLVGSCLPETTNDATFFCSNVSKSWTTGVGVDLAQFAISDPIQSRQAGEDTIVW